MSRPVSRALAVALALAGPACASHRAPAVPSPGVVPRPGTEQEGIASWYGPGYAGNRTFCGERFDPDELTAAHPSWACGTKVRVTLLSSRRSVAVRINDRFPAHKGRIIDLSREAARRIGLIGPGTGRVRLDVLP